MELGSAGLTTDTAISEVKRFLMEGWYGAAQLRLEDILSTFPDDVEAKACAAWTAYNLDKRNDDLRTEAVSAVSAAVAVRRDDSDLYRILGYLLKIGGRYEEASECFRKAWRLNPWDKDAKEQCELMQLRKEPTTGEWPEVQLEEVDVRAPITLQTRLRSRYRVQSYHRHQVRIGCARHDNLLIGDTVVPAVVKNHCTIIERSGRHFVRRNGSLGRVWLEDVELPIREEVPIRRGQTVRLGGKNPGEAFEVKVITIQELHDSGSAFFLNAA